MPANTQSNLFEVAPPPVVPRGGYILRDYQQEDANEICRCWEAGDLHVLCVHATGLGKSLLAAELAGRKPEGTIVNDNRALIVVDSTDLTKDLYKTVKTHLGRKPGIITGDFKEGEDSDIIIATKQCLCAGDRYLSFDWTQFDRIIIDECESALANEYLLLIAHILERNPKIKLCGLTATPLPSGNRKITDLFPHAAKEPGPLYRDLQWAYLNGWLVKPMQGVLRCSLDFASLKLRKLDSGEQDYSDRDITKLMLEQDEREWLELAGGIYQISKGHTAIVVCPNSTVVADKLAGYIEGHAREAGQRGIAYSIHRALGRRSSWDLMRRFKRGEFPIAVSCKMFEKGFDFDKVDMIIMARRTRSLRLYTQVAGRATRPLTEIRRQLSGANHLARMRMISQSAKPSCVMVDCVGVDDDAKNILGVIDILGRGVRDDIKERVRRMMLDKARAQMEDEGKEPGEEKPPGEDVGKQARKAVVELRDEWERERRAALSAKVEVSYETGNVKATKVKAAKTIRGDSSMKQVTRLIALGVAPDVALASGKKQAGAMIGRYQKAQKQPDYRRVREWQASNQK